VRVTDNHTIINSTPKGNDMSVYLDTVKNNLNAFESYKVESVKVGKYG